MSINFGDIRAYTGFVYNKIWYMKLPMYSVRIKLGAKYDYLDFAAGVEYLADDESVVSTELFALTSFP